MVANIRCAEIASDQLSGFVMDQVRVATGVESLADDACGAFFLLCCLTRAACHLSRVPWCVLPAVFSQCLLLHELTNTHTITRCPGVRQEAAPFWGLDKRLLHFRVRQEAAPFWGQTRGCFILGSDKRLLHCRESKHQTAFAVMSCSMFHTSSLEKVLEDLCVHCQTPRCWFKAVLPASTLDTDG
eukprot:scaffold47297_cov22-Tisochrysis_lutea.AAC.1